MRLPSEAIPQELRTKDPVLDGFVEVLDTVSETAYKELLKGINWNKLESVPDSALDFLLFEWGLAIFEGYSALQKRRLLEDILEIDSKRYTQEGLAIFLDAILPTMYVDVKIPVLLNQISFRNPTIGFPNPDMRETAGREEGDINPYIFNGGGNRRLEIFLFAEDKSEFTTSEGLFTFLEQVIPTELPDLNSQLNFQLNRYEKDDEDVTVAGTTVTGTGSTTFTSDFTAGDFIGLYSTAQERVFAFKIATVVSDSELELVATADTSVIEQDPTGVSFWKPWAGEVGVIAKTINEDGSASEELEVSSELELLENGTGSDEVEVDSVTSVTDSGTSEETLGINSELGLLENGNAVDEVGISYLLEVLENGGGVDSLQITITPSVSDQGGGEDSLEISADIPVSESSSGSEEINIPENQSTLDSNSLVSNWDSNDNTIEID